MNLLTQAPELFLLLQESNRVMSGRSNRCRLLPAVQTRAINLTKMIESVGRSVLACTAVLSMKHF
jgi:hypothetical protein